MTNRKYSTYDQEDEADYAVAETLRSFSGIFIFVKTLLKTKKRQFQTAILQINL